MTTRRRVLAWGDRMLLTLLVVLLIHAVATTRVYSFESSDWGLVSRLPVTYWGGLAVLGLFWVRGRNSRRRAVLAFAFTVGYLYVAPAIVRVPVWLSNSFYPYGEGVLIAAEGHLVERPLDILTSYHRWPAFLYLTSGMSVLAEVPAFIVLQVFPVLTMLAIGVLAFLTFRKLCSDAIALAGAGWVVASFWLRQHYFGPPGISYIFFLLIFLFGVEFLLDDSSGGRRLTRWFLMLFCFTSVVLTHALTSFMALIVLFVLWLTRRVVQKEPANDLALLSLVSASILASYYAFVIPTLMKFFGESLIGSLSRIWELSIYKEPSRLQASAASVISYNASLAIVAVNFVVALAMVFYLLRTRHTAANATEVGAKRGVWMFSLLSLVLLGLFAFAGEYGAHESYQRAFMYGLVPLALLSISLLRRKPKVLILCLAALIFLNVPAQYGSDNFRVATAPQLAGSEFFAQYVPENISCLTKFSLYIRYFNPAKNYRFYSVGELPFTETLNATVVQNAMDASDYVVLSDLLDNYYLYYVGENPFDSPTAQEWLSRTNRVYDNHGFQIYASTVSPVSP
jgi:hypothetical protein